MGCPRSLQLFVERPNDVGQLGLGSIAEHHDRQVGGTWHGSARVYDGFG